MHHQLQMMGSLVKKMGEIVAMETRYVEKIPLATFLEEDTTPLLEEANSLVECQVNSGKVVLFLTKIYSLLLRRALCMRDNKYWAMKVGLVCVYFAKYNNTIME